MHPGNFAAHLNHHRRLSQEPDQRGQHHRRWRRCHCCLWQGQMQGLQLCRCHRRHHRLSQEPDQRGQHHRRRCLSQDPGQPGHRHRRRHLAPAHSVVNLWIRMGSQLEHGQGRRRCRRQQEPDQPGLRHRCRHLADSEQIYSLSGGPQAHPTGTAVVTCPPPSRQAPCASSSIL